jgi:hypothetical protein
MERRFGRRIVSSMKTTRFCCSLATLAIASLTAFTASGQYYEYQFQFHGTAYQTNATGNIVGTPITDQTLLADRAYSGGITDLSTVAIVYHIGGGSLGDTIDIVNATNGATLTTEFGLYFGSSATYGRTAVTNATQTEERRVDYIYTFSNSGYTISNPDSVGAAFVTKRYLSDGAGHTNTVIDGTISWDALPHGTNNYNLVCVGSFTLGKPLF